MAEEHWIWRCDCKIANDPGAGRQVLDELLERMNAEHWAQHDVYGVCLAMEEALVNAILHGNRLDADKRVHIDCRLAPELVRIEITDEGDGFDPSTIPNPTDPERLECPSGRGVMLIKAFMSRVWYNAKGNSVVMEKGREKA